MKSKKGTALEAVKAFLNAPDVTKEEIKTLALGLAVKLDELTDKVRAKPIQERPALLNDYKNNPLKQKGIL